MSETSRLRWLCRRGMKELDVVLTRYLDERYDAADAADQALFRQVLEMPDPDLYSLLLGRSSAEDPEIERFLRQLQG